MIFSSSENPRILHNFKAAKIAINCDKMAYSHEKPGECSRSTCP